jgi:hypothetical protein
MSKEDVSVIVVIVCAVALVGYFWLLHSLSRTNVREKDEHEDY